MSLLLGALLIAQLVSSDPVPDPSPEDLESPEMSASGGEDSAGLPLTSLTPSDPRSWPIGGALGARLYCIEYYESRHYGGARNPWSGARGWLQWLPGTARAWGVIVGDRISEWHAASRIAERGETFFRSQWVPLQRGWC